MNNNLYELTKSFENKKVIYQDFNEIINIFKNNIQNKYIKKVFSIIDEEQTVAKENPNKEISLIKALKEFNTNKNSLDDIINVLTTLDALKHMQDDLSLIATESKSEIVARESTETSFKILSILIFVLTFKNLSSE